MAPTAQRRASPSLDEAIARLATRQYGVISRNQLRALGLTDSGIAARIRRGTLHRRHQSVYAVGPTVVVERGRWMAAVLACGDTAVLSHAAAGALWALRESDASVVDVTVPGSGGRRRKQRIRIHRARSLDGQTTVKDRIPVTTPGRTILDLAARLDRRGIERLLDRAEHARLGDDLPLDELARAHTGHRRHAGLPKPTRVNDHVELLEADFVFAPSASSSGPTAGRALTTALDR